MMGSRRRSFLSHRREGYYYRVGGRKGERKQRIRRKTKRNNQKNKKEKGEFIEKTRAI